MRPARRGLRALVGIIVAVNVALAAGMRTAGASTSCTTASGVTVIVDFTHWGGNVERGCASGHPATGLDALHSAGFATVPDLHDGAGFVCRIDDRPSQQDDACVNTPPGNAYWSYYHAMPDDAAWTYSVDGAMRPDPPAGSIEAWAFGANAKPSVSPRQVGVRPPPTETPTTTTPHETQATRATVATVGTTASSLGNSPPRRTQVPATIAPTSVPSTAPKSTAATTPGATGDRAPATGSVRIVDRAAAPAAATPDSGSPLAAILTVVAIGALSSAALLVARARRRSAP